jgi:hypothetical protein
MMSCVCKCFNAGQVFGSGKQLLRLVQPGLKGQGLVRPSLASSCHLATMDCGLARQFTANSSPQTLTHSLFSTENLYQSRRPTPTLRDKKLTPFRRAPADFRCMSQSASQSQQVLLSEKKPQRTEKRAVPKRAESRVTMEEALALQGLSLFARRSVAKERVKEQVLSVVPTEKAVPESKKRRKPPQTEAPSVSAAKLVENGKVNKQMHSSGPPEKAVPESSERETAPQAEVPSAPLPKPLEKASGRRKAAGLRVTGASVAPALTTTGVEVRARRPQIEQSSKPASDDSRGGALELEMPAKRPTRRAHSQNKDSKMVGEDTRVVSSRPAGEEQALQAPSIRKELRLETSVEDALAWCCEALGRAPGEAEQQLVRFQHQRK